MPRHLPPHPRHTPDAAGDQLHRINARESPLPRCCGTYYRTNNSRTLTQKLKTSYAKFGSLGALPRVLIHFPGLYIRGGRIEQSIQFSRHSTPRMVMAICLSFFHAPLGRLQLRALTPSPPSSHPAAHAGALPSSKGKKSDLRVLCLCMSRLGKGR
jgi:hypothetical protein